MGRVIDWMPGVKYDSYSFTVPKRSAINQVDAPCPVRLALLSATCPFLPRNGRLVASLGWVGRS